MKLFGTDGIRGRANRFPMTPEIALRVGKAVCKIFKKEHHRATVLIGKDTRISGYLFETAIASGVCAMGGKVYLVGPMPTPGVAFLTKDMRADAGIVISASHNPYFDNGIKIFSREGFKLEDDIENSIEDTVLSDEEYDSLALDDAIGTVERVREAKGRYVVFVKNTLPMDIDIENMNIALDCANGALYSIAPLVFEELGARLELIGVNPNGININNNCGAVHPENLSQVIARGGFEIGFSFDGDGDRAVVIDEKGNVIPGDALIGVFAAYMKENGLLKRNTVVGTIMTNMGLEIYLKENEIDLVRTPVGDRYIVERMRKDGYNFGGEESGHIVLFDLSTTGDGLITALFTLRVMLSLEKPISVLASNITLFPSVKGSLSIQEKKDLKECERLSQLLEELSKWGKGRYRAVVRYSGTEPKVRIMVEGEDRDNCRMWYERIKEVLEYYLGVVV